jgi:hypothetical protein
VLDVPRISWIWQRGRQRIQQAKPSVDLAQQERSAVRGDRLGIEDRARLPRAGEREFDLHGCHVPGTAEVIPKFPAQAFFSG